jgi:hypothetical protein
MLFGQSLDQLLKAYWRTECSDPRDKVYALLGLVRQSGQARTLEVDYSITMQQLYQRVLEMDWVYVPANTLRLALGYTEVHSEGQIWNVTRIEKVSNNIPLQTSFRTQRPPPNNGVTWIADCVVKPGDTCYSFPGRRCLIIFRKWDGPMMWVGAACAFSPNSDQFTSDLNDLESSLLTGCLFDNTKLEVADTYDDGKPRHYAQMSSHVLAEVESYTRCVRKLTHQRLRMP